MCVCTRLTAPEKSEWHLIVFRFLSLLLSLPCMARMLCPGSPGLCSSSFNFISFCLRAQSFLEGETYIRFSQVGFFLTFFHSAFTLGLSSWLRVRCPIYWHFYFMHPMSLHLSPFSLSFLGVFCLVDMSFSCLLCCIWRQLCIPCWPGTCCVS